MLERPDPNAPHRYTPRGRVDPYRDPAILDERPCHVCGGGEAVKPHLDWDREKLYGPTISTSGQPSG